MKVLITGMSASQASLSANMRSMSFAGVIHKVLSERGHTVSMLDPDIKWSREDLKSYDAILVGISPVTSLSASKSYGALHVIDLLAEDPRLKLVVDAPYPSQITASLRAILATPSNLTKDFYAFRQGYQLAATESVSKRLLGTVDRLLNGAWMETIYPSLPWQNRLDVAECLPAGATASLTGINLDSWLVSTAPIETIEKVDKWVADSPTSTWTKKIQKTLGLPVVAMKHGKAMTDIEVGQQIGRSAGSLITPYRDGTWWTYRQIQSLNHLVPVVTDWKDSQAIGHSWAVLGSSIESMSRSEREELAWQQAVDYLSAVLKKDAAAEGLEGILNTSTREESYAV